MPLRTTLNISLPPELEQFVQQRVASGRYQTASEVVREGLRLLEQQERDRQVTFKELKAKLRRGPPRRNAEKWLILMRFYRRSTDSRSNAN